MLAFFKRLFRREHVFAQVTSVVVAVAVVCLSLEPQPAQAQSASAPPYSSYGAGPMASWFLPQGPVAHVPPAASAEERYAQTLMELKELLRAPRAQGRSLSVASRGEVREWARAIRVKKLQLEELEPSVDASFASVGRMLDERKLSPELKARHKAAEQDFKTKLKELKGLLKKVEDADVADSDVARAQSMKALDAFLEKTQRAKRHRKLDPKKLNWRVHEASARKPARTPEEFRKLASVATPSDREGVLAQGSTDDGATGTPSGALTTNSAATASVALEPELAETDDAQMSQAVRDLAASLGNDPVRIFNWVRNNIAYVPSFGSIQGSDVTLAKRSGNAFDTASLLIALLRVSGVPARYVHGTIRVPAANAMNWVGGVNNAAAAQQLWSQGGVPNIGMISGGKVSHVEIEHVWVEAFVDFNPSRGSRGRQGDSWVPLDASFKTFDYEPGLLASALTPRDLDSVAAGFLEGALVDGAEGWVQNPSLNSLDAAASQLTSEVSAALERSPGATNADVYGRRTIVKSEPEVFASSLPYQLLVVGARYADLPPALTHRFQYRIFDDAGVAMGDGPVVQFSEILPRLAGKQITLRYAPASQADAELMAQSLPQAGADGEPPTQEQLAAYSLPAYLVRLRPEILVDGVVRARGGEVTMGAALSGTGSFTQPGLSAGWDESTDALVAGQVTAIGLNVQGIGREQMARVTQRVQDLRARLERGEYAALQDSNLGGDLLALPLNYFFWSVDEKARRMQASAGMVDFPALSFGLAHVDLGVSYLFGVAWRAKWDGLTLDVGHLRALRSSKDNDRATFVRANVLLSQYASWMEHAALQEMFVGPDSSAVAVSSVILLRRALQEGQRVYVVTPENAAAALPKLTTLSADVMTDIRAAVAQGRHVTVHEKPLVVGDWRGVGYVVMDPETGSSAYMIEGGQNGGNLRFWNLGAFFGIFLGLLLGGSLWLAMVPGGGWLMAILVAAVVVAMILPVMVAVASQATTDDEMACFLGGFNMEFSLTLGAIPGASQLVGLVWGIFSGLFVDATYGKKCAT